MRELRNIIMKYLREREEEQEEESSKRIGRSLERFHHAAERIDRRDRILLKNEEERSVFEEVFDRQTLMKLYGLANRGAFAYLNGAISSGKEAKVYWGVTNENKDVAVKIYLVSSSDFKRRSQYILGDPRFQRFRRDSRGIAEIWARKEFTNLNQAQNSGAPVPKPLTFLGNVLVMEFIGEGGVRAPTLAEVQVVRRKDYLDVLSAMKILYSKAELVHADLSEFNIFKLRSKIIVFDLGSAVSIEHPMAFEFLKRDVSNVNHFFEKKGLKVIPEEKVLASLTRKHKERTREKREKGVDNEEEQREQHPGAF